MKNLSGYIDLVFCIIVLPVMMMIFPVERWFHNFRWYVTSVGIWLYLLYFLNRFITVPCLFKNIRKKIYAAIIIAISLIVTYKFSCVSLYTPKPNIHDQGIVRIFPSVLHYQQTVWSLFMIVEAFSFAVGLLTQTNIQRSRRRQVEAQRDKAEIELYKAQIKPHFMFNTLNTLYGLFLTGNEKALVSLERFISMMRYINTSSMRDMVPLRDETDYIRQYVALQSLRLNEMTTVTLDISVENEDLAIPPMLLVTFVENCFKHGVSPVEKSDIDISLHEQNGALLLTTGNRIFPVKRIGEHMGIGNCRKRLELLYPDRHELSISSSGQCFSVKLRLDLTL
ncbi:MAG: histidine kinase [Muribaculaceae bacterium]|nr:histidine kinase [Muribaculaceae bacterium]